MSDLISSFRRFVIPNRYKVSFTLNPITLTLTLTLRNNKPLDQRDAPCPPLHSEKKGSKGGTKVVLSGEPSKVQQRTEKRFSKEPKKGCKT